MKLGKYNAINESGKQNTFLKYVASLDIPIIDYIAIGIQNTVNNTSASLMSRCDWQKLFRDKELSLHDPVRRAALASQLNFFSFDEIDYYGSSGKEVMRQRRIHYIQAGMVVIEKQLGHSYMLTLGTGYRKFSSCKFYIDNNVAIKKIFIDLKKFVSLSDIQTINE